MRIEVVARNPACIQCLFSSLCNGVPVLAAWVRVYDHSHQHEPEFAPLDNTAPLLYSELQLIAVSGI